jgi:hypothetical protein
LKADGKAHSLKTSAVHTKQFANAGRWIEHILDIICHAKKYPADKNYHLSKPSAPILTLWKICGENLQTIGT